MDEVKLYELFKRALAEHHNCPFNPEDRSILKDVVSLGKLFKKFFLFALVAFLIVGTVFMAIHMLHSDAFGSCWIGELEWETSPQILAGVSLPVSVAVGWIISTLIS